MPVDSGRDDRDGRRVMRRAAWRLPGARCALGVCAGIVVLLAGCASPAEQAPSGTASEVEPVAVPGVAGCSGLQRRHVDEPTSSDRLPQLTLPCLTERRPVDVSQLGGKPLVVNLWASWCGPCRSEMPRLAKAAKGTSDVGFLGINTRDDPQAAADFLTSVGATYPQLVDEGGEVLAHTRVPGLPVTLALDAQGRVVDRVIGEVSQQELNQLVASLARPQ